jgi:hypothetical protein
VSPQRELSRILLSVAFHFHSPVDYRVSLERIITGFALSGLSFPFPSGFLPCLLRKNYHGFCPQWLCIFILSGFIPCLLRENYHGCCPQWLFYFHSLMDFYRVSSERTITDFALTGFIFLSLSGFTQCLLRENLHGFYPQWFCIFIPQWICSLSPQRELSRILPSVVLYFHPSVDLFHVSSERTFTDFIFSGLLFSSPVDFYQCLLRENYSQWILCLLRENYHGSFPSGLSFLSLWISCFLRENFHGFYPQWFSFYLKSLIVLSFFYFL